MIARLRQSEFPLEWCAVACAILVDFIWARVIGFHLMLGRWRWRHRGHWLCWSSMPVRGFWPRAHGLFFEYIALSLLGSFRADRPVLSLHGQLGSAGRHWLLAADRALGFDWLGLYRGMARHPLLLRGMD